METPGKYAVQNVVPATVEEINSLKQVVEDLEENTIPDKFQISNGETISFSEIEGFELFKGSPFTLKLTFKYSERFLELLEDEASHCYGWLLGNCFFSNYGMILSSGTFTHN